MNYSDLDNLCKQQTSTGENLEVQFEVLDTGRVAFGEPRAPIQIGDFHQLYTGQYLTTSQPGNTCSVHAYLSNFYLSAIMVPDGDSFNDASCESVIRCQPV